jgi:hypothetical protein
LLEPALEPHIADHTNLQRESDPRGGALRRGAGGGGRPLGEPDDAAIAAEVVVPQFGVSVQPKLAHDRPLEGSGQEVGQEVRAGLLGERVGDLLAPEHVVAVIGIDALHPEGIERAVGPAVPVGHRDGVVARPQAC